MSLDAPTLLGWALLVAAGLGAGFVNSMAGGGSILTLSAMMLLGFPADVANGTNRVNVVAQCVSGVLGYRRRGHFPAGPLAPVLVPVVLGGTVGAAAATAVPAAVLEPILLGAMVLIAVAMVVRPSILPGPSEAAPRSPREHPRALLGLFLAGLYGGFVQAGVGFVMLAVLGGILRYDALSANALKLLGAGLFATVALGIFIAAGDVRLVEGLVLTAGAVLGSQLGVRFAVKVPVRALRALILVCVLVTLGATLARSCGRAPPPARSPAGEPEGDLRR